MKKNAIIGTSTTLTKIPKIQRETVLQSTENDISRKSPHSTFPDEYSARAGSCAIFVLVILIFPLAVGRADGFQISGSFHCPPEDIQEGGGLIFDICDGRILSLYNSEILFKPRPCGSIIKILTTYSVLNEGLSARKIYLCVKSSPKEKSSLTCWYRPGHGNVTLTKAISQSCNAYYRQWLADVAPEQTLKFLQSLRLIESADIEGVADSAMDLTGLSPRLQFAPVRFAAAVAAIFNGGKLYHFNEKNGERATPIGRIEVNSSVLQYLIKGMAESGLSGSGQTINSYFPGGQVLVKTGTTAHVFEDDNGENKLDELQVDGLCLALFPADEPRWLALAVVPFTNGAEGGTKAAGALLSLAIEQEENEK